MQHHTPRFTVSLHAWPMIAWCLLLAAGLLQVGCVTHTTKNGFDQPAQSSRTQTSTTDQTQLADLAVDGDVNDPTAASLHELAGNLLLYKATHGKLPANLADVFGGPNGGNSTWAKSLIDPVTSQPFVYTPNSKRHPKLPGRMILHQPVNQGSIGRWALLFNDQAKDGNVITYVQRVPEELIPVTKNTTRITR